MIRFHVHVRSRPEPHSVLPAGGQVHSIIPDRRAVLLLAGAARRAAEARHRGLRDFFTEDVVWHVGGNHPSSGDYEGREDLLACFRNVHALSGQSLQLEPESILASDEHVAMFTRVRGDRDGSFDTAAPTAFTVDDQGRFSQYWWLPNDQALFNDFWS